MLTYISHYQYCLSLMRTMCHLCIQVGPKRALEAIESGMRYSQMF